MERMLFPKQIQKKIKATKEEDEIWGFFCFFFLVHAGCGGAHFDHGQATALVCVM